MSHNLSEEAIPNPEYLIKSIAEQGYSLETALADLMDNSISANADKIEVLIDMESEPFRLYLGDNGDGMTEDELKRNMHFPSNSPEKIRSAHDLGRFGLGLKTASFSQTRSFTVLSRKKGAEKYSGRTWNVEFLKENGWKIIVNSEDEITGFLNDYNQISKAHLAPFSSLNANTIVIWEGLYKFENYLDHNNRKEALRKEINEITIDYLSLVLHRFLEREKNPVGIRINNYRVNAFNPFPNEKDIRQIEPKQARFRSDAIKVEGFVLPARSIEESKKGNSIWTTRYRGLMDMEGIYIYRADRIILFGSWNGLIKKAPRLQLARLKVEVGNSVDHLLHLNVAKSQIIVPYELREAFEEYVNELKLEAEREFFNRGIRKFSGSKTEKKEQLFERINSSKGTLLEINPDFPLIRILYNDLDSNQQTKMKLLFRMIGNRINEIRKVHEEIGFTGIEEKDGVSIEELKINIKELLNLNLSVKYIKDNYLPHLGYRYESLPEEVKQLLNSKK